MVNFIRRMQKEIALFLLLIANLTVPMEERFLYGANGTGPGFCAAFTNGTTPLEISPSLRSAQQQQDQFFDTMLTYENIATAGTLAWQVGELLLLKTRRSLFGFQLMDKIKARDIEELVAVSLLWSAAFGTIHASFSHEITPSDFNSLAHALLVSSSMIHISNLIHQKALEVVKNDLFDAQVTLKAWAKQIGGMELLCYCMGLYAWALLLIS